MSKPAAPYRGRFAPSPTGELHFGSLVAALASWLRARQHGGDWLLRVEDIDPPREVAGSAQAILDTLDHFGLHADAPALYQSRRDAAYADALRTLQRAGHAFACWCSRSDLDAARILHHELHHDGHCLAPPRSDRPPAWRLRVPDGDITFNDALQGAQCQNVRTAVGDFVLRRADGRWSYQLACVVDDAHQGVTEVVRGCDLLDSTPRQILLQQLLHLPTPAYLHLPLAVNAAGEKLAKSSNAPPVTGDDPLAAIQHALHFLGQPVPDAPDLATLLQRATQHADFNPLRGITTRLAD